MEGRVPTEVFEPSLLRRSPVQIDESSKTVLVATDKSAVELGYDKEAEALVAAQLRALGYIE
jgi:hypothetical protein